MRKALLALLSFCAILPAQTTNSPAPSEMLHPRIVIVVYFERGADTGDAPGELQFWVERDHLTRTLTVPGMTHVVHASPDGREVAITIGEAQIRSAVNLMAFAADPRFDLHDTYWLINGIAGVSPRDGTLADAFWTDFVVNGDHRHSIDERDLPKTTEAASKWPDGVFALQTTAPNQYPASFRHPSEDPATWPPAGGAMLNHRGDVIRLNPALLQWAYNLTHSIALPAPTVEEQSAIATYSSFPAAHAHPTVRIGANIATEDFWYGPHKDDWAHRWVAFSTHNTAHLGTTAMNDTGALLALWSLTQSHRADWNRALLLRTVSNFDRPPDHTGTVTAYAQQDRTGYPGFLPALESAYAVGEPIVRAILSGQSPATH